MTELLDRLRGVRETFREMLKLEEEVDRMLERARLEREAMHVRLGKQLSSLEHAMVEFGAKQQQQ